MQSLTKISKTNSVSLESGNNLPPKNGGGTLASVDVYRTEGAVMPVSVSHKPPKSLVSRVPSYDIDFPSMSGNDSHIQAPASNVLIDNVVHLCNLEEVKTYAQASTLNNEESDSDDDKVSESSDGFEVTTHEPFVDPMNKNKKVYNRKAWEKNQHKDFVKQKKQKISKVQKKLSHKVAAVKEMKQSIADGEAKYAAKMDSLHQKIHELKEEVMDNKGPDPMFDKPEISMLRVVPWLLLGEAHELSGEKYCYIDGPERQVYRLDPVGWNDVYRLLPRHKFTVLLTNEAPPDALNYRWDMQQFIHRAATTAIPHALGIKSDLDMKNLMPMVMNALGKRVSSWPDIDQLVIQYLIGQDFAERVRLYHMERLRRAKSLMESRLYRFACTIDANEFEVKEALEIYNRWYNKYLAEMSISTTVGALATYGSKTLLEGVIRLFAATTTSLLSFQIYNALRYWWLGMKYSNVRKLLTYVEMGGAYAKFACSVSIPATCSGPLRAKNMIVNDDVFYAKFDPGRNWEACEDKKPYVPYGVVIQGAPMVIPKACHHDQANGLAIRFLFARNQRRDVIGRVISNAEKMFLPLFKNVECPKQITMNDWLAHIPGKRRNMLIAEPECVDIDEQWPIDIFVKLEPYLGKTENNFKPRIIMGRRLALQYMLGQMTYIMSKVVSEVLNADTDMWYVGGCTPLEVGKRAQDMFVGPGLVKESDVSNWDGSQHPLIRDFEVWFIEKCTPAEATRWKELKTRWNCTCAIGKRGVKVRCNFCRNSGDGHTSPMNSVINAAIVKAIDPKARIAMLGDDNFWKNLTPVSNSDIVQFYADIGMKVEIKDVDCIENLEFCSGKFYWTDAGYKWGVKPFRVLAKFGLNLHRHPKKVHKQLLYGTALSMLPIANHVPILGEILSSVVESGRINGVTPIEDKTLSEPWRIYSSQIHEVTPQAYECFVRNYALSDLEIGGLAMFVETIQRTDLLDLFPMVLYGPTWIKCFRVDVGCNMEDERFYDELPVMKVEEEIPYFPLLVAPILEETMKYAVPALTLPIGLYETYRDKTVAKLMLHGAFAVLGSLSLPLAVVAHSAYNYYVWRNFVDYRPYGDISKSSREGQSFARGRVKTLYDQLAPLVEEKLDQELPPNWRITEALNDENFARKQSKQQQQKPKQQKQQQKHKNRSVSNKVAGSLGRSLLTGGLGALGGLLGPAGAGIGRSLGDWGATVLGMGDYSVKVNSLTGDVNRAFNGVPAVHSTNESVRVRHKEYLGDITGSTGFNVQSFVINPGSANTFPWLSKIANMFQQYKIRGMFFEFLSTSADALNSTNTALGTVVMATQYNVASPDFLNKAEMLQYEYSNASRPSASTLHMIECNPELQVMPDLFTRYGSLPAGQDYQFYDWGNFQIATVGMQAAANIGELWVSYDIEFLKPRIASGGTWPGQFTRINNGPFDADSILGILQTNPVGNLGVTITAGSAGFQRVFWPATVSAGRFYVNLVWRGDTALDVTLPALTLSNCTYSRIFALNSAGDEPAPSGGTSNSTNMAYSFCVTIDGYSASGSYVEVASGASLPGLPLTVDIFVVGIPLLDTSF